MTMEVVIKMKKINVFFAFAAVLILVGGVFTVCELDTTQRVTVTFSDLEGGNTFPSIIVEKGEKLGNKFPNDVEHQTNPKMTFYGWFDGANQYDEETPIGANVTLTACYSEVYEFVTVKFTFTQKDNSGKVIQPTATFPDVKTIKGLPIGVGIPTAPRSKGWEFLRWERSNGTEFNLKSVVTAETTVTAVWKEREIYTVYFDPGPGSTPFTRTVYANECIDEWSVQFPPTPTENPINPDAFFVAWQDDENLAYTGRTIIDRNNISVLGKWGLPPKIIDLRMVAQGGDILDIASAPLDGGEYGTTQYNAVSRLAWDSTTEKPKQVIVNNNTYDVPYNPNRWRILYRIHLQLPETFSTGFYTRYTIRARFYANRQGAATWLTDPDRDPTASAFTPNKPAAQSGYKAEGLLTSAKYKDPTDPNPSRSDDGWGQISWTSEANWNGQGADAETMLQRYNLDRKGGTIDDPWAPLKSKELPYPPYLLIQTSDNYIGHIEVYEIVFHNGEKKYTMYEDEEGYDDADDGLTPKP